MSERLRPLRYSEAPFSLGPKMTHPLDGARLKVDRAREHLASLKDGIARYLNSHPYHVPLEVTEASLTGAAAVLTTDPPLHLSCLLGDCIGNLRASLDYVAWQLGTRDPPSALDEGDQKGISFPIVAKAADYHRDRRVTHLSGRCGVPAMAMRVTESVQPYNAGYEALSTLNVLANTDKHRLLLFTVTCLTVTNCFIVTKGKWTSIATLSPGGYFRTPFGTHRSGDSARLRGDVEVVAQAVGFVAIKGLPPPVTPVDLLLGDLIKCVADIIPRFDPFV